VESVARLAGMNLVLHGIGPVGIEAPPSIEVADSLLKVPDTHYDVVLTNPPFGRKSTFPLGLEEEANPGDQGNRPDFLVRTANKQLLFLQHVLTLLKPQGRAAVIVPENLLFENGAAAIVRRFLLTDANLHTILRLPPGLFYAQGLRANILFFTRETALDDKLWIYDLRTEMRVSLKTRPITADDLREFVACFRPRAIESRSTLHAKSGRWAFASKSNILRTEHCSLDVQATHGATDVPSIVASSELLASLNLHLTEALREIAGIDERIYRESSS
jgi:type I restriction enzyme M protein